MRSAARPTGRSGVWRQTGGCPESNRRLLRTTFSRGYTACCDRRDPANGGRLATNGSLIDIIRAQYALEWNGLHGFGHWERVLENGRRLALQTGANVEIVDLFALLHDSKRLNDAADPDHGPRAAEFARSLCGSAFHLDLDALETLAVACRDHTKGLTHEDPIIATCWDADRLDLWRVGKRPDPALLCTDAARDPDVIAWACRRAETRTP